MFSRLHNRLRRPEHYGLVMLIVTTAAAGFAMSAQGTVVANYFADELGLAGPQFGYITAIREIPGFLLIFLTALFYRLSLPHLTAGALLLLSVGYGLFGWSTSFWTVAPWVILSSVGYHTWLQTQYALGMSLTTESRAGRVLGLISSVNNAGSLAAMLVVAVAFQSGLLTYRSTFVLCGALALIAALAIVRFPRMRDGKLESQPQERERVPLLTGIRNAIVLRREYRYYYLLSLLDGGRQQIFFSFGLWVLVSRYGLEVPAISAILIAVTALNTVLGAWIGRLFDRYGEKPLLAAVNVGYVVALAGYALVDNVVAAVLCYVIYSLIFPVSGIGAATYLRKVAVADELAPSLAMGVTLQHAAAIVVPVATGVVLNYVGYQIPFLVACGFACLTFLATQRLAPERQKSPRRLAEEARLAASAAGGSQE
ncbi:MAG: MFS transporter [Chloroflexota bacterium]